MNLGPFRRYQETKAGQMKAQAPEVTDRRQFLLARRLEQEKLDSLEDGSVADLIVTGSFAHRGTTFGVFNETPATQAATFTQTFSTASRTVSAATAAALTDSTTGTADATVQDVTGAHDQTILNNNFADLTAQVNALIADNQVLRQLINALIDDSQRFGFTP